MDAAWLIVGSATWRAWPRRWQEPELNPPPAQQATHEHVSDGSVGRWAKARLRALPTRTSMGHHNAWARCALPTLWLPVRAPRPAHAKRISDALKLPKTTANCTAAAAPVPSESQARAPLPML